MWKEYAEKYYLNHVGYKAVLIRIRRNPPGMYYLNHVGYKVQSVVYCTANGCSYYLNHVGYKVAPPAVAFAGFQVLSEPCGI